MAREDDIRRIVAGGRAKGLGDDQIRALVARYDERTPQLPANAVDPAMPAQTTVAEATRPRGGTVFGRQMRPDVTAAIESAEQAGTVFNDTPLMPNVAPALRAARAVIPSAARAGANFQTVMGATRNVPIDISNPGNTALRIMTMAERGGTMPKVVRDFLKRVTDPGKQPMVYEEARDFASNISRLSADEFSRLTPALRREVGNLRVQLNHAVEKATQTVGQGDRYRGAMREYGRAARGRQMVDDTAEALKRWAVPGGVAVYGVNKLSDLLRGSG